MKLTKLYEIQGGLKAHIDYKEKDKFEKMMLALLVEVGEAVNDWRGFKYWSQNQESKPTLLEEYVDGFHFVLEAGLDLLEVGLIKELPEEEKTFVGDTLNITKKFKAVMRAALRVDADYIDRHYLAKSNYTQLLRQYLGLGAMLGFSEEQIIAAYLDKNKVNHERQNNGY